MSVPALPSPDLEREHDRERDRVTLEELAAAKRDLTATIGRQIDWLLAVNRNADQPISVTEAAGRMRSPLVHDPIAQGPEQVSWHELGALAEHEPERARDAWGAVKDAAREELRTGLRAARSLERTHATPLERAQFLAILEGLRESLRPAGGAEMLLVQMMATALEQHFRWQTIATRRVDEESWQGERDVRRALERMSPRQRERHEELDGWLPPRQSDAEAIDQAVLIADRYQRQYLQLLRALRDMRRVMGTVVMTGGQLNVAEQIQQVNVVGDGGDPPTSAASKEPS